MQPVHDRGTGNAFSFGSGQFGQLGLGEDVLKRNYPSLIDSLEKLQVKTKVEK
jgi:alpha-tubulin suppressor-like RCC1 family protein